jgi:HlyD family secretion protein
VSDGQLDLAGLSRKSNSLEPPKRSWLRILLPLGILLVFVAVLLTSLGDLLERGIQVERVTPRTVRVEGGAAEPSDRVLVQAAGWIEPDPFLVHVSALAAGVVEEVLVQESDVIAVGDAVAKLVDEDASLARDRALAEHDRLIALLADSEARHAIAVEQFAAALTVTEAEDVARAVHIGKVAEAEHRAAAVAGAEAQVQLAKDELLVQQELETHGAGGLRQVELAQGAVDAAESAAAVMRADVALAEAEATQADAQLTRAVAEKRLRFDDRLERDRAAAGVQAATASVALAKASLDEAQLRLDRMIVRSPVAGVVLERLTVPGMVLDVNTTGHEVCSVYDPTSLRVRVDVPQDDVEQLFVGQRAEIQTNARPGRPYTGEILRLVQLADIQKVTLEAQVRITDGDALIRPDMLAQVRFFGSGQADGAGTGRVMLIPERLVTGGAVWVLDPNDRTAVRRTVELGGTRGEDVEVLSGLNATDKVLDSGDQELTDGARVRFTEASL